MASGTSWLKGCALGCGLMVVLAIVGSIGGGALLMKPFKNAIHSREALEDVYGEQTDYRPPPDGVPAPDRIEVFLDVREVLMAHCDDFGAAFAQFRRMDELDNDEISKGKMFTEVLKTVKEGFGMAGKLGRLAVDRNETLTERGMGLGEYTYIYALVYYAWLDVTVADFDDSHVEVDDAGPRVRRALRTMLEHQSEDVRDQPSPGDPALLGELEAELARLEDDRDLYPWQGAVPERIATALAPYRGRLEAAFCVATAPFALTVTREEGGGLSIHSD